MSNHFTGLSLGPPLGDQRLDLCDLYAFVSPADSSRTVLILNANPNADALQYIEAAIRQNTSVFPDGAMLRRLEMLSDLDRRQRRVLSRMWTEIKVR